MTMLDIFKINGASMGAGNEATTALLDAMVSELDARRTNYEHYREYWNGEHNVRLTTRLKQFLTLNGFEQGEDGKSAFSDNHMGVVVAALVDRLKVQGFAVPGEPKGEPKRPGGPPDVGALAKQIADWWELNRGDALEKQVHEHAVALGDAYVITDWDVENERPRFTFNPPELCNIVYDPADANRKLYATKRWVVTAPTGAERFGTTRLNVYYPDRIEKYQARNNAGGSRSNWEHYTEEGEPWPLPWTDEAGVPLGIPVFHWRNDDRGGAYGRSELADAIPMQDALNKALVDGLRVADAQGWQQRWGTGIEEAIDADVAAQPGSIIYTPSPDAKWGQFDAADPESVIKWMQHLVAEMADVTQTPAHLFRGIAGEWPSGEALKLAEAPLVMKAKDRQVTYGNEWEALAAMAVTLANANGGGLVVPDSGFDLEWESAESRPSELERIQAINAKMGLSNRQRLHEYGYTDEEIERISNEAEGEMKTQAEIMATEFDAGTPPNGGGQ